jgi:hypothetical protein
MAEESELPFPVETDNPNVSQAKRVAEVTAQAHRKVEKRKKRGDARVEGRRNIAAGKKSAKRTARMPAKKTLKRSGPKKSAGVKGRRQKVAAGR